MAFNVDLVIGFLSRAVTQPSEEDDKKEDKDESAKPKPVVEESAVSADTTALIETKTKFVDMIAQFHIKHLNISVLSDYEAELELFYIYFKVWFEFYIFGLLWQDVTGDATMYKEYSSANVTCRFEALVNNLNFLTPEKFIEPVHFSVNIKKLNEGAEVEKLTSSTGSTLIYEFQGLIPF